MFLKDLTEPVNQQPKGIITDTHSIPQPTAQNSQSKRTTLPVNGIALSSTSQKPKFSLASKEQKRLSSGHVPAQSNETAENSGKFARVLYDFIGESTGELSINTGEMILVTRTVDADWLEGTCEGLHGIFPAAFVEVTDDFTKSNEANMPKAAIESNGTSRLSNSTKSSDCTKLHDSTKLNSGISQLTTSAGMGDEELPKAKVLYDFQAVLPEEVSVCEGEAVFILDDNTHDWTKVKTVFYNAVGLCPSSFLQREGQKAGGVIMRQKDHGKTTTR